MKATGVKVTLVLGVIHTLVMRFKEELRTEDRASHASQWRERLLHQTFDLMLPWILRNLYHREHTRKRHAL